MKKQYFLIALVCLVIPVLARLLWFYQGFYLPRTSSQAPEFEKFLIPQPTLSTQVAQEFVKNTQRRNVLVDFSHANRFSLSEIDPLTNIILQMGANIQIDYDGKDFINKLQDANAYIVIAPTTKFSKENIQAISDFVDRGGRLLIIADPTRTYQNYYFDLEDSVLIANQIIDPFDIAFKTDYLYSITHNEGNYRNIYALPVGENQILAGISNIVFYGAHPMAGSYIPLLQGDETTLSSGTDQGGAFFIAGLSLKGNVLVLGDMGFMVTPYNQVVDNYRLVLNIANYLAGTARTRSLADFPNLFSRDVNILQTVGFSIDKTIVAELSSLQSFLKSKGLNVTITSKIEDNKDLLVLGTYPPSNTIDNILGAVGIHFKITEANSLESAFLTEAGTQAPSHSKLEIILKNDNYLIPGIGVIPASGFNFVLYGQTVEQNILVLLAESPKNVIELLKLFNKGSLKDCMLQPNVAVCAGGISPRDIVTPLSTTPTPMPTPSVTATFSPSQTPAG